MFRQRRLLQKYSPKPKTDYKSILILIVVMLIGLNFILWGNKWTVPDIEFTAVKRVVYEAEYYIRDISAYNVGIEWQTDDTPCIGATGEDLCLALARGEKIVAANFVPLGTMLNIEGLGTYRVADRMNRRYPNRVDIAFTEDQLQLAREFGVKQLLVGVIK